MRESRTGTDGGRIPALVRLQVDWRAQRLRLLRPRRRPRLLRSDCSSAHLLQTSVLVLCRGGSASRCRVDSGFAGGLRSRRVPTAEYGPLALDAPGPRICQLSSNPPTLETVRHDFHSMRRITSVMTRPMIGSATCTPRATSARAGEDSEAYEAVGAGVVAVCDWRGAAQALPGTEANLCSISMPTKPIRHARSDYRVPLS